MENGASVAQRLIFAMTTFFLIWYGLIRYATQNCLAKTDQLL